MTNKRNTKTKKIIYVVLLSSIVVISTGIGLFFYNNIVIQGTITYVSIEGGFYGILDKKDNHYEPINLLEEFELDGLAIFVIARFRRDLGSFVMWGEPVEIRFIKNLT